MKIKLNYLHPETEIRAFSDGMGAYGVVYQPLIKVKTKAAWPAIATSSPEVAMALSKFFAEVERKLTARSQNN